MLHIGFTILDHTAQIIVKNDERAIIHREALPLGEAGGVNAEWLACKAAIRRGGALNRGAMRLYSDCGVIEQLVKLDPAVKLPVGETFPTGGGKLPQHCDQELYHFVDAVSMLWTLFKGKWEAYHVEQERILR